MVERTEPDQILSRRGDVEPFHAMDVLREANRLSAKGEDIAYLCVGQPAASAPKKALEAVAEHLTSRPIGYTDASGREDLKHRLAAHYLDSYGIEVSSDRVFVTTGSSAGFNLAFLALFNPGDRVAITSPGYPAYRNILKALSIEVVEIETKAENRWALTPEELSRVHEEKPVAGVLIASPANPTGTMMSAEALKSLISYCDTSGIRFISDEIYHDLVYDQDTGLKQSTALSFSDQVIVINSFSKFYCMTGWRIGWMILPDQLVRPIERLAQSLYISPPELSQVAALHALDCRDELVLVRKGYLKNRNLLLSRLPELGFDDIMPIDGAFYAYANASRHTNDTMKFAYDLLAGAGVAVTPGYDFDQINGNRFIRISFAGDFDVIRDALGRMETWLNR